MNRAAMRDVMRRNLLQVPPIDDGAGISGAIPLHAQYPTNAGCNYAIDEAVAFFSQKCGLGGDVKTQAVPFPIVTENGPYAIALQQIAPAGSVNDVRHVSLTMTGGSNQTLVPTSREEMDRSGILWEQQTPGTPQRFWVEAGSLVLWPAPSSTGSLNIQFGKALWSNSTQADAEVLEIIPTDYLQTVLHKATAIVALIQTNDAEMHARGEYFLSLVGNEAQGGLADMLRFFNTRNKARQGSLQADQGRVLWQYGNR